MKYYKFMMKVDIEKINKQVGYEVDEDHANAGIDALNYYLYQNLFIKDFTFFIYRTLEDVNHFGAFSYDENIISFDDAYNTIVSLLYKKYKINNIHYISETTVYDFIECHDEGTKRDLITSTQKFLKNVNSFSYFLTDNTFGTRRFKHQERIAPEKTMKLLKIFDDEFINELTNIKSHPNTSEEVGNIVHYVISSRSDEVAIEMIDILINYLYKANRILSRRIEYISEISSDMFEYPKFLNKIIDNSGEGVIVFNLSEKLGNNVSDYHKVCIFIKSLVEKYKNKCLFIFMHKMDNPGFAYQLLPSLNNCITTIKLNEGNSNRQSAKAYLKQLIKASKYAKYIDELNEFINDQLIGNEFTQSDVYNVFSRFEAWHHNNNLSNAYHFNYNEDVVLNRDKGKESAYKKLDNMIGLTSVKEQIKNIIAVNIVEKERKNRKGTKYQTGTMHMVFGGNPGTAKTTIAKLFGEIAKEEGFLKSGSFVELSGTKIFGNHLIHNTFIEANGGILFIDEAYAIKNDDDITILIQEMENHKDDVIVILAGYTQRMKKFMLSNEGLKSRIPYWIDFPDYNVEELTDIFKLMIEERGLTIKDDALKEASYIFEKVYQLDNFGNGRYVRNILEHSLQKQSSRIISSHKNIKKIKEKELFLITKDDIEMMDEVSKNKKQVGSAAKELKEMIGLTNTKIVIEKIIASFKIRKLSLERGISKENNCLHMVFSGNPGTAKTTVARLLAQILKDENILSTGTFVEVGRADLIGQYVGHTAPLIRKRFQEAQGGILFIDEAYSLNDGYRSGYGDEAINTIVQEMENNRNNVIVIFAGYPEKMKYFLNTNPGLVSRIAFNVEFDDYSVDELCEITKLLIQRKQLNITKGALNKLNSIYEGAQKNTNYGNGRFVRKMIEISEMNLAERLIKIDQSQITTKMLTTIDETDIPDIERNDLIQENYIS